MKKVQEVLSAILTIIIIFGIGAVGGYFYRDSRQETEGEIVEHQNNDLILPGETERRKITKNEIEAALVSIQEFATYSGKYTVEKTAEEVRDVLGWDVFGATTNSISMKCQGVAKVGFDVSEITVEVDNDSETIYIHLPSAKVLDNYVIWDTVECEEKNNVLNPIEFTQYQAIISEMEEEGLEKTKELGIFDNAREHFEKIVKQFLSGMTDYKIVFM